VTKINQTERAARCWAVLAELARRRRTASYSEVGTALRIHHRAVKYALAPIQDFCLEEGLPPLTILVINGSGKPGDGFIAHSLSDLDRGIENVWSFDWSTVQNPFDFSSHGLCFDDLVTEVSNEPSSSGEVYRLVKSRGVAQAIFKKAVRNVYSDACAFTGISFFESLEACHIVPWSTATADQRLDVRNGLLLNRLHHSLFDNRYLTVTPDFRIRYMDPMAAKYEYSEIERRLTIDLDGAKIRLPRLTKHRPLAEFLEAHNRRCNWISRT
jgi:putative restriction endonuclease